LSHKKQILANCLLIILFLSPLTFAENITLDLYPSEQEIYDAYICGEIDFQTYLNLSELLEDGVDSTDLYLLEEIPNINYFLESFMTDYTELELEQFEMFIAGDTIEPKKTGFFRTRTYQELEEEGDIKNFITFESKLTENWKADIRYSRDFDGDEKCSRRSLLYKSNDGQLSRMVIGNFTARFGLGLTVGYRGKILSKTEDSFENSFPFPDYGGFNGLYLEGGGRDDEIRMLLHYDRNNEFSLRAGAIDFARKYEHLRLEAIVQGAIVKNRQDGSEYKHYQFGGFARYDRRSFDAAFEVAVPKDESSSVPTMLFEARIKGDPVSLQLSAWNYTDDFINLTGGGRAGSLYETVEIDSIAFDFRDKRFDQKGFLVKNKTDLSMSVRHEFAFSAYGSDKYNNRIDLTNLLVFEVGENTKLRLGYRYARHEEPLEIKTKNEYRAESRFVLGGFDFKSYIEYTDDLYDKKFLSCFVRARSDIIRFGRLDIWINFDKIDYDAGRLDYFYGYIDETLDINSNFEIGAKYSYRYSRSCSDRYVSQIMLETKVKW